MKRAESGMIIDPVTLPLDATVKDAQMSMKEHRIGGIPIIDNDGYLKGIVTNQRFTIRKGKQRPITEIMTAEGLVTTSEGTSLQASRSDSSKK